MRHRSVIAVFALVLSAASVRAQDLNEALEKAVKDAVRKVAPSVVQIVTQGGADLVVTTPKGPAFRKTLGPTTGVIVADDGYIISSTFNFLNSPTSILVSIPGQAEPVVAKRIANDKSRLLTLLKIDAKGLPVPKATPKKDIIEGQTAIALGRTLDSKKTSLPSVSVGIISAVGRIWGKALQTDAKISPVNYGGPIIDVQGRIEGILIPASPQGEDVTAGFEWYDSGIGFAIPFEDVLASLPRLKDGKDLEKGIVGVRFKGSDIYSTTPEVLQVNKDSPADKAGLKAGDQIVEVDGQPVSRLAQIQHLLGVKYEGDKIALKYKRGKDVVEVKSLVLVSSFQVAAHPFLGILPLRDDPRLGVEIRHVFAKSPAEKAGLQPGDRIMKIGLDKAMKPLSGVKSGRDELLDALNILVPGNDVQLEIKDKAGKTREVMVALDVLPGSVPGLDWPIPEKLTGPASFGKARAPLEKLKADDQLKDKLKLLDPKNKQKDEKLHQDEKAKEQPAKDDEKDAKKEEPRKVETGFLTRATGDGEHKYWVYVPKKYDDNIAHGVLVWLHPPNRNKEGDIKEFVEAWEEVAEENNLILVAPKSDNADGWIASEADFVVGAVRDVSKIYTVDAQRVVAHGMGVGGQLAMHLGMNHRDLFRGVITVGAVPGSVKDNQAQQRLAFYLVGGELDPLIKSIADARVKLAEKRYSAVYREMPNRGREYLTEGLLREAARWIETLDKQ
jgi:serine protease Do